MYSLVFCKVRTLRFGVKIDDQGSWMISARQMSQLSQIVFSTLQFLPSLSWLQLRPLRAPAYPAAVSTVWSLRSLLDMIWFRHKLWQRIWALCIRRRIFFVWITFLAMRFAKTFYLCALAMLSWNHWWTEIMWQLCVSPWKRTLEPKVEVAISPTMGLSEMSFKTTCSRWSP